MLHWVWKVLWTTIKWRPVFVVHNRSLLKGTDRDSEICLNPLTGERKKKKTNTLNLVMTNSENLISGCGPLELNLLISLLINYFLNSEKFKQWIPIEIKIHLQEEEETDLLKAAKLVDAFQLVHQCSRNPASVKSATVTVVQKSFENSGSGNNSSTTIIL